MEVEGPMIQLLRNSDNVLEAYEDGKKHKDVKLIRSFPLTMPEQFISVRSDTNEEIIMITDLSLLEGESRRVAEQELQRYYMSPTIESIISLNEIGCEWVGVVDTSSGRMNFRMNEKYESVHPLSQVSWSLSDIEGRRFIILNIHELDENSLKQWEKLNNQYFIAKI
ncbi:hypothetical protein PMSM_06160 [Paenibacillus macquariensis subsp. macquariensis]|uniref:DUF1854 domain-containing protein n=2 Tax=Paenibacillus macquariensis TaxID=948756 RepID=A0ABY1JQX5_9BACL|nr:hypothetical protein PMSM_06160 [Paenibacillus macquariensis subsp. macquariensis]SIQ62881.1 protein of unknown function [Paenibacillus macquariensis]